MAKKTDIPSMNKKKLEPPERKLFRGFPRDLTVKCQREAFGGDGFDIIMFNHLNPDVRQYYFTKEWQTKEVNEVEELNTFRIEKGQHVMRLPEDLLQKLLLAYLEAGGQIPGINNDELQQQLKLKDAVISAKDEHLHDMRHTNDRLFILMGSADEVITEVRDVSTRN